MTSLYRRAYATPKKGAVSQLLRTLIACPVTELHLDNVPYWLDKPEDARAHALEILGARLRRGEGPLGQTLVDLPQPWPVAPTLEMVRAARAVCQKLYKRNMREGPMMIRFFVRWALAQELQKPVEGRFPPPLGQDPSMLAIVAYRLDLGVCAGFPRHGRKIGEVVGLPGHVATHAGDAGGVRPLVQIMHERPWIWDLSIPSQRWAGGGDWDKRPRKAGGRARKLQERLRAQEAESLSRSRGNERGKT